MICFWIHCVTCLFSAFRWARNSSLYSNLLSVSAVTASFFSVPNTVVLVAGVVFAPNANPARFALLELESLEFELSDLPLPKVNPPAAGLAAALSDPTLLENIELESFVKAPNCCVDVLLSPTLTFVVDEPPKENPPVDLDSPAPTPILNAEESPLSPSVFLSPKEKPEDLPSVLPDTDVLFVAPAPNLIPEIGDEVLLVVLSLLEPN